MDYKVNEFTTINDFKRLGTFVTKTAHGELIQYENFSGKLDGAACHGLVNCENGNIYGLKLTDVFESKN